MEDIYLGNPLLKKANVTQEFTQEQSLEFMACKQDPVYFAKRHVKIVSLDEGLVPFEPYDFQERLINNFHNNLLHHFIFSKFFIVFNCFSL